MIHGNHPFGAWWHVYDHRSARKVSRPTSEASAPFWQRRQTSSARDIAISIRLWFGFVLTLASGLSAIAAAIGIQFAGCGNVTSGKRCRRPAKTTTVQTRRCRKGSCGRDRWNFQTNRCNARRKPQPLNRLESNQCHFSPRRNGPRWATLSLSKPGPVRRSTIWKKGYRLGTPKNRQELEKLALYNVLVCRYVLAHMGTSVHCPDQCQQLDAEHASHLRNRQRLRRASKVWAVHRASVIGERQALEPTASLVVGLPLA